ncbi:MAG: class I SAM-dependent methyltransferase [Spirochaetaceae bacterium]
MEELAPERILAAAGIAADNAAAGRATAAVRTIVDLGAGPGFIARGVSALLPVATLHALDVAPELVEYMRGELSEEEARRIIPQVSDESTIDLEDDTVDFLFMVDVYHELENAAGMLAESLRVLRPGGVMLVIDWAKGAPGGGPPDHHRVPVEVLESEMREAGFSEVGRRSGFSRHHAVRGLAQLHARRLPHRR